MSDVRSNQCSITLKRLESEVGSGSWSCQFQEKCSNRDLTTYFVLSSLPKPTRTMQKAD